MIREEAVGEETASGRVGCAVVESGKSGRFHKLAV